MRRKGEGETIEDAQPVHFDDVDDMGIPASRTGGIGGEDDEFRDFPRNNNNNNGARQFAGDADNQDLDSHYRNDYNQYLPSENRSSPKDGRDFRDNGNQPQQQQQQREFYSDGFNSGPVAIDPQSSSPYKNDFASNNNNRLEGIDSPERTSPPQDRRDYREFVSGGGDRTPNNNNNNSFSNNGNNSNNNSAFGSPSSLAPTSPVPIIGREKRGLVGCGLIVRCMRNAFFVDAVLAGSDAEKNGMLVDDEIVKINNQATSIMTPPEAEQLLLGQPGSSVQVTFQRVFPNGKAVDHTLTLVRSAIDVQTAELSRIHENERELEELRHRLAMLREQIAQEKELIIRAKRQADILDGSTLQSKLELSSLRKAARSSTEWAQIESASASEDVQILRQRIQMAESRDEKTSSLLTAEQQRRRELEMAVHGAELELILFEGKISAEEQVRQESSLQLTRLQNELIEAEERGRLLMDKIEPLQRQLMDAGVATVNMRSSPPAPTALSASFSNSFHAETHQVEVVEKTLSSTLPNSAPSPNSPASRLVNQTARAMAFQSIRRSPPTTTSPAATVLSSSSSSHSVHHTHQSIKSAVTSPARSVVASPPAAASAVSSPAPRLPSFSSSPPVGAAVTQASKTTATAASSTVHTVQQTRRIVQVQQQQQQHQHTATVSTAAAATQQQVEPMISTSSLQQRQAPFSPTLTTGQSGVTVQRQQIVHQHQQIQPIQQQQQVVVTQQHQQQQQQQQQQVIQPSIQATQQTRTITTVGGTLGGGVATTASPVAATAAGGIINQQQTQQQIINTASVQRQGFQAGGMQVMRRSLGSTGGFVPPPQSGGIGLNSSFSGGNVRSLVSSNVQQQQQQPFQQQQQVRAFGQSQQLFSGGQQQQFQQQPQQQQQAFSSFGRNSLVSHHNNFGQVQQQGQHIHHHQNRHQQQVINNVNRWVSSSQQQFQQQPQQQQQRASFGGIGASSLVSGGGAVAGGGFGGARFSIGSVQQQQHHHHQFTSTTTTTTASAAAATTQQVLPPPQAGGSGVFV